MTQKPTNELFLDKHVDFIVNYGKTHDKYVFNQVIHLIDMFLKLND